MASSNSNLNVAPLERRGADRRSYPPTPVEVDWECDGPFVARSAAITIDRSMDGFSLIIVCSEELKVEQRFRLKPPDLPPLDAIIRWQKRLDDHVVRVGCAFASRLEAR